jgi:polyvinyl alcohol dehydrogenase (cytochrome)
MVPDPPKLAGKNAAGVDRYANSGIGVRVTPTLDPGKRALYVTTGENYSEPATSLVNAFVALSMDTGKILWSKQITPGDVWNVACISPDRTNCPFEAGPDANFGMSPILVQAGSGQRLLIAGQKSGVVTAVDPDRAGEIVWQTPIGKGGLLGGIQWGGASDGRRVYIPLSDYGLTVVGRRQYGNPDPKVGGGLFALDIATGRVLWQTAPPVCPPGRVPCSPAQSAAATLAPGAIFSGAMDGVLRAYDSETGRVIWSFDTVRDFETVNNVPARGGSMDGAGPVVAGGMVYVTSGYTIFGGMPGNALLAFRPK